jgi:hypothetical protein
MQPSLSVLLSFPELLESYSKSYGLCLDLQVFSYGTIKASCLTLKPLIQENKKAEQVLPGKGGGKKGGGGTNNLYTNK